MSALCPFAQFAPRSCAGPGLCLPVLPVSQDSDITRPVFCESYCRTCSSSYLAADVLSRKSESCGHQYTYQPNILIPSLPLNQSSLPGLLHDQSHRHSVGDHIDRLYIHLLFQNSVYGYPVSSGRPLVKQRKRLSCRPISGSPCSTTPSRFSEFQLRQSLEITAACMLMASTA